MDIVKILYRAILRATVILEDSFLGITLVAMVALMFTEVMSRYIFHNPLAGMEETTRYLVIGLCFMGAARASRDRSHVKVAILTVLVHGERRLCLTNTIVDLISLVICSSFALYSYRYLIFFIENDWRTNILGFPLALPAGCIFIGVVFICFHLVICLAEDVASLRKE